MALTPWLCIPEVFVHIPAGCWNLPPSVFPTDQQELQLKNIIPTGNPSQEECGWGSGPPEKLLYLWILILSPGTQLCTSPFS